jgi:hypothetical protein
MKAEKPIERPRMQRRRLLCLLGGLGILGLAGPSRPARRPRELSVKEADYYRPHDLAG